MRACKESSGNGKWYKEGEKGTILGQSSEGDDRYHVKFDQSGEAHPRKFKIAPAGLEDVPEISSRVRAISNSCTVGGSQGRLTCPICPHRDEARVNQINSKGNTYRKGDIGCLRGISDQDSNLLVVQFDEAGEQTVPKAHLEAVADKPEPPAEKTVLFVRHVQGIHNVEKNPLAYFNFMKTLDPGMTEKGRAQAESWVGKFEVLPENTLVLVSPLKRTVQTACLALQGQKFSMQLCSRAREQWWASKDNQAAILTEAAPRQELEEVLAGLPGGGDLNLNDIAVEMGFSKSAIDEEESWKELGDLLAERTEGTIVVVSHDETIRKLMKASGHEKKMKNAEVLTTTLTRTGKFSNLSSKLCPLMAGASGAD